ncbi:MAG: winged helix-turn-helix domain-containing protein [Kofleriaceae bacterium]
MTREAVLELLSSSDPADLAEGARAVGRDLAHRRTAEVDLVRRHLEDHPGTDDFARGFTLALEQVASAFAVAGAESEELSPLLRAVALRAGWRKVLTALADGAARPSELALRTTLSRGRISHILGGLERTGLIERPKAEPSGDGRQRPCRLSPLGYRVLVDSAHTPAVAGADLDAGVVATTALLARLLGSGRASRAALEEALAEHLDRAAIPRVVDTALRAARNAGLAVVGPDQAVTLAELHLQDVVSDALADALADDSPAIPVIELARARAPEGGLVVVRSELMRSRWDIVIAKRGLDDMRLIASADWFTGEVDRIAPRDRPFAMVYDSPTLARSERGSEHARALLRRADSVFCYAVAGTVLPDDITAIEVA